MKTVFYEALGKSVGDKMHKGANAWDLLIFFMEVQKRNLEQGRKIKFKLRKQAGVSGEIPFEPGLFGDWGISMIIVIVVETV